MKVGDTVKLKPAMWQGIKPESYGLSFTGEYIVSTVYDDQEYPSLRIEGIAGTFDVEAFQLVILENTQEFVKGYKEVMFKFKAGDIVYLSQAAINQFSPNNWGKYHLPLALYNGAKGIVERVEKFEQEDSARVHVNVIGHGHYFFMEEDLELTPVKTEEKESSSALDKQISGDHYKSCGIQPIEYIHANGLSYLEGNVIKYTTRHSKKNGRQDIEKAIHYLELILEMEYKDDTK